MLTYTDASQFPFGKYQGKRFDQVPASYLIFLSEQKGWVPSSPVGRYITENMEVLKQQARNDKNLRR